MANDGRQEFAAAVTSTIEIIQHLYREVDKLYVELRTRLKEQSPSLRVLAGTGRRTTDPRLLTVRHEYGVLFVPMKNDEREDIEEDPTDEENEENGGTAQSARNRVELASGDTALVVRIALYEPTQKGGFEPQIQYAIMNQWSLDDDQFEPNQTYKFDRKLLLRVPSGLSSCTSLAAGTRHVTKARVIRRKGARRVRHLTCLLQSVVRTVPLFTLNSAEELSNLASQMRDLWYGSAGTH